MRITSRVGGTALAVSTLLMATAAQAQIDRDPSQDADCVIALSMLAEQSDDQSDTDAIIGIAMYYLGRLGGEGRDNVTFLTSRMGRFVDDETLFATESEKCATDFETAAGVLERFADSLE